MSDQESTRPPADDEDDDEADAGRVFGSEAHRATFVNGNVVKIDLAYLLRWMREDGS